MKNFWLCFVPLFIAVDAIGAIPLFLGFVEGLNKKVVQKLILQSLLTALVVALAFLFVGEIILRMMGITVADFMVAGGIVLFMIALRDLLTTEKLALPVEPESLGPVPIGVPLIVGPAVLTTIMLLVREYGFYPTTIATIVNIAIAGIAFRFADIIIRLLGKSGSQIASKISNLLLAAIAVMLVRKGVMMFINGKI